MTIKWERFFHDTIQWEMGLNATGRNVSYFGVSERQFGHMFQKHFSIVYFFFDSITSCLGTQPRKISQTYAKIFIWKNVHNAMFSKKSNKMETQTPISSRLEKMNYGRTA